MAANTAQRLAFELAGTDAVGQAALVAAGDLSAVELLEAAITRLAAARDLNAVITLLQLAAQLESAAPWIDRRPDRWIGPDIG